MQINHFRGLLSKHDIKSIIIIASTFRSGSTYLAELLKKNHIPGLGYERFNFFGEQDPEELDEYIGSMLEPFSGGTFPAKMMWPHRNNVARVFGLDRRSSKEFKKIFPKAKWIFVERDDIFSQAVSMWRAKVSGRWHVYSSEAVEEPPIEYDFEAIDDCLLELSLHNRLWRDFFSLSGIKPYTVNYENLVKDVPSVLTPLLKFLGHDVPNPVTYVPLRKQSDALSDEFRSRLMEDLFTIGR